MRRRQPSASGRDAGVGHLLRSLYQGPLRRKKLSLALPGAFSLAKLSGSPYLGGASHPGYEFPRKPRRHQAAGFSYWAVTVVSSLRAIGRDFPQKLVACKAMASSCGTSPKIVVIRALLTAAGAVPEAASERKPAETSSLVLAQAAGACAGVDTRQGFCRSRPVAGEVACEKKTG